MYIYIYIFGEDYLVDKCFLDGLKPPVITYFVNCLERFLSLRNETWRIAEGRFIDRKTVESYATNEYVQSYQNRPIRTCQTKPAEILL